MTLLWWDGFESNEASAYTITGGSSLQWSGTTRFGYGLSINRLGGTGAIKKSFTAAGQVFVGAAFNCTSTGAALPFAFYGDSGATQHLTVKTNTTNFSIEVYRGTSAGTLLASSANNVWSAGTWFYLEVSCTIADSGGTVEVRINGGTSPIVTFTGDTKNAGTNSTVDAVELSSNLTDANRYDDFYICNSSGSSPANTFLGDVRCVDLIPTGAGSSTGLTASTGSNWQTVDEAPPVSTDYSGSATSGARDTYATSDLPSGAATVYGARLSTFMHKSDAGVASMKPAMKVGSNVYYGSTQALPTSQTRFDDLFLTSPATSAAWTVSEINGIEIGAEVV